MTFSYGKQMMFDYVGECAEYLISKSIPRTKNVNAVRKLRKKQMAEKH